LIGWSLRGSVGDAAPPAGVWERIRERLILRRSAKRVPWWRVLRKGCKAIALWLFDSTVGPPAEFAYCYSLRPGDIREKGHLSLLLYQCDLPTLLGRAM
jgi:hypothetical protein